MSLRDDYNMYYGGTWVGFRPEGSDIVRPFCVQDVSYSTRRFNPQSEAERYGEQAIEALKFMGYYVQDGDHVQAEGFLGDGRFVLDNPDLGYVTVGGRKIWTTYRPHRSTKKGLTPRRVAGWPNGGRAEREFLENLYKDVSTMVDPNDRLFDMRENGTLFYKGREIATTNDGMLSVHEAFNHVKPFIIKAFPDKVFSE